MALFPTLFSVNHYTKPRPRSDWLKILTQLGHKEIDKSTCKWFTICPFFCCNTKIVCVRGNFWDLVSRLIDWIVCTVFRPNWLDRIGISYLTILIVKFKRVPSPPHIVPALVSFKFSLILRFSFKKKNPTRMHFSRMRTDRYSGRH